MPRKKGEKLSPELVEKARQAAQKGGRPRQEFIYQKRILKKGEKVNIQGANLNLEEILFFIKIQATQEEIASHYFISPDTLSNRLKEHTGMGFSEIKKMGSAAGRLQMRVIQYNQSKNNPTMAKHLGEIWLDQKQVEKLEITTIDIPVYLPSKDD